MHVRAVLTLSLYLLGSARLGSARLGSARLGSARLGARTQPPQGGSAGLLGAFVSLVKTGGLECPLHCVLCIAENSVSTLATRPDDVHTFYSGRTVEVNNTDAEGRRESARALYRLCRALR